MIMSILILVLMSIAMFILSLFFRKKRIVFIVIGLLLIVSVILVDQLRYTTFSELYADQLNEETEIKSISITKIEHAGDMQEESITIDNENIIEEIVKDLSELKLKNERTPQDYKREYQIDIVAENRVEEDQVSTSAIHLRADNNYVNDYKIISDTNYLRTIESLFQ